MASRRLRAPGRITWASLLCWPRPAVCLAALAPIAITFMAVAGLGAGIAFEGCRRWASERSGSARWSWPRWQSGAPSESSIAEGAVSVVVGLMVGASRRQYVERTFQAEQLLAERVRADAERDRAAALAERNRIGREVHDVLAHSLGALSVQLDAADALLESGDDSTKARQLVQQARRLAVQGLEETRQAVHALRDEPVALAEQLASLAARDGAELTVTGATPSTRRRCRIGPLSRRPGGGHQCPEARTRGAGVDPSRLRPAVDDSQCHQRSLPRRPTPQAS